MEFNIITAFPNSFSAIEESIVNRAVEQEKVKINIIDLRNFTEDKRKTIDDKPFGGGAGMLLKVEPIYKALKQIDKKNKSKTYLTSARGENWNQNKAKNDAEILEQINIICGHYEGVDNRVVEHLVDEEVSIGNYVLSGGEIASMVIVDTIVRLIPGVVGNEESVVSETSFDNGKKLVEYPQYTRPAIFITEEGYEWSVPEVLLSGNHKEIEEWKENKKKLI